MPTSGTAMSRHASIIKVVSVLIKLIIFLRKQTVKNTIQKSFGTMLGKRGITPLVSPKWYLDKDTNNMEDW